MKDSSININVQENEISVSKQDIWSTISKHTNRWEIIGFLHQIWPFYFFICKCIYLPTSKYNSIKRELCIKDCMIINKYDTFYGLQEWKDKRKRNLMSLYEKKLISALFFSPFLMNFTYEWRLKKLLDSFLFASYFLAV
jgi:hypothetical protein